MLDFFGDWRTVKAAAHEFLEYDERSIHRAVQQLYAHSLLERSDRSANLRDGAFARWSEWHPSAGFFHFSTKNMVYTSGALRETRLARERTRSWPVPPSVKRYPGKRPLPLPEPSKQGEFPQVLLSRRTWRRFSRQAVTKEQLSTLLGLTARVQQWVEAPRRSRLALKTTVSCGSRHPIEVYVLALRVDGLQRGIYHYAADLHALEQLAGPDGRWVNKPWLPTLLPEQVWTRAAPVLLFLTSVFAREQWKYPFSRAYRALLLDAGHLCQNICLVATWLGLAAFSTMALGDSKIDRALGLDGVSESVLYAAGVGVRPKDNRPDFGLESWPGPTWQPFGDKQ
ncbi:MAG: SagB family peptide dehydrogenase [Candidatus Acidiferrales bacterium]